MYRASRDAAADNMDQFAGIKKSGKHGRGLFALKDFKPGERAYVFKKGKIVGRDEIKNLPEVEKMHLDKIGENEYEVIKSPGCYVNHSCEPNVKEKNRTGYALRDIKQGEEITIDYDKIAYLEKPFKCRYGSKTCHGFARGRK